MFLNVKCVGVHQWLFWSTVQKNVHVQQDSFPELCHKYIKIHMFFSFLWKTPKATISLLVLVWMCCYYLYSPLFKCTVQQLDPMCGSWPGFPCTMPWQCVPYWKNPDVPSLGRRIPDRYVPALDSIEVLVMTCQFCKVAPTQYICVIARLRL
jgi:hypothetical protein